MNRVVICAPDTVQKPITQNKDWLNAFCYAGVSSAEELKQESIIRFIVNEDHPNCDGEDVDNIALYDVKGTLLFTATNTAKFGDISKSSLGSENIYFADANISTSDRTRLKNTECHVGFAIFKTCSVGLYQNFVLLAIQSANDLKNITLRVIEFNGNFKNDTELNRRQLLKEFADGNTNFIPVDLMLNIVYMDKPELSEAEKYKMALDSLFKTNLGLDGRHVFNRYQAAVGIGFTYTEINKEKKLHQKTQGRVIYRAFGNQVIFHFDISDAPIEPTDLKYKSVSIEVKKLYEHSADLDEGYLMECAEVAFKHLCKFYLLDDYYFKNL